MSFAPVIPFGGYAGWRFLARTYDKQLATAAAAPAVQRDKAYFTEKIGTIKSAEALVADRRLLSVALGAFGLQGDINNRYFVRKILESSTLEQGSLANRLADKRYLDLAKTFGFGDFATPATQLSDFAGKILARYDAQQFEVKVGEQDDAMRLALNARRELGRLAERSVSNDVKWFGVMGSAPLRNVMQTALGLPPAFSSIDLDKQLAVFKERAERFFGTDEIAAFRDPEKIEEVVRLYFLRAQGNGGGAASAQSVALSLLRSSGSAFGGLPLRR